ncbi:PIN domain-containing protein [Vibrio sp. Vb0888]|uniref:PIN domain-containing protein n=1 Tax=Vibrio sp. Vb0888 TaxID=3074632 RepID=UPI0029652122|nr:PIN domain-containing protein [Vibrio sp. Vb0888]MDW1850341.1 PIN domain-containing protein [Vibrio sp. Vb0888]
MPKVVLDTNILRENSIDKSDMVILARLSRESVVDVYIPNIVKREYLSQQFIDLSDHCQKISSSLQAIRKKTNSSHPNHQYVEEMNIQLQQFKDGLEAPIKSNFDDWMKVNCIKEVPFNPEDIVSIIDDYFSGGGVFKKAKHRDDFPDAMISKGILSLAENEPVTVLCKDGNFHDKLTKYDNISVFRTLREFLDSPQVSEILSELNQKSEKIELVKGVLASAESQKVLIKYISSEGVGIEDVYLTGDDLSGTDNLLLESSYNSDIQHIDVSSINNVNLGEIRYINDDMYSIDIQFGANALVNYAAYYGDYVALDEMSQEHVDIDSMNGDGYCECSELRAVNFSGAIEIYLNTHLTPDDLAVHMQYFSANNTNVSGVIEVISGAILE